MFNSIPLIWKFRFSICPISVMLHMPFCDDHNIWNPPRSTLSYVSIDSDWPKIMLNISPQLEETEGIFPRKNLKTREPP